MLEQLKYIIYLKQRKLWKGNNDIEKRKRVEKKLLHNTYIFNVLLHYCYSSWGWRLLNCFFPNNLFHADELFKHFFGGKLTTVVVLMSFLFEKTIAVKPRKDSFCIFMNSNWVHDENYAVFVASLDMTDALRWNYLKIPRINSL